MESSKIIQIIDYCLSEWKKLELPWCEFKQNFHSTEELGANISALANMARIHWRSDAYIIFGINPGDHSPVGTTFNPRLQKGKWNEDLIPYLQRQLSWFFWFNFFEVNDYKDSLRMVVCIIQPATISPVTYENVSYIRIESYTKPVKQSKTLEAQLWETLLHSNFDTDIAMSRVTEVDIFELIDWKWYCEAMKYDPISEDNAKEKLVQENLIIPRDGLFDITNACAFLFARDLANFGLKSKSPRVITYRWNNKLHTINDQKWSKWFAIAFPGLINYVISQIPKIENIEIIRKSETNYPKVTLREFIANAIIHQDFHTKWSEVLIEIYDDRIEISNPGTPLIEVDRFLDHPPKSRNEIIADFMRRAGHCEKRWSWVDRALAALQVEKLPNPKIEKSDDFTRVTLYRYKSISKLTNDEKAQAIYWHCVLTYILENEAMTNDSVCDRFNIEKQNSAIASRLIKWAVDLWKIKPFDPNSKTRKHRKYIPFWVN